MATTKRGPKTPEGKTKSAKNSTKHGLRSQNLSTTEQIVQQSNFLQELIDHYKPVGPLEEMQLERIATCRVKLKSLYELEQAKMDLLIEKNKADLQKQIAELSNLSPLERGMLHELIKFKILMLPLGLDIDLLKKIVQEFDEFSGDISTDEDLKEYFPALVIHLNNSKSNASELHVQLFAVNEQLQRVVNRGENYKFIQHMIRDELASRAKKREKELDPEEIAKSKAIDDYIEMANRRRQTEYGIKVKKKVEIEFPSQRKILEAIEVYRTLLEAYEAAISNQDIIEKRVKMKELTVSLPIEEADLLMRYQTAWERRLSTSMGEFMRMQEMRIERESAQALLLKPKTRSRKSS